MHMTNKSFIFSVDQSFFLTSKLALKFLTSNLIITLNLQP